MEKSVTGGSSSGINLSQFVVKAGEQALQARKEWHEAHRRIRLLKHKLCSSERRSCHLQMGIHDGSLCQR